jgi:hypothetical protein
MTETDKTESVGNENKSPQKPQEDRSIHIHLDGNDFSGFSLRIAGIVATALLVRWLTNVDGFLIFIVATVSWLAFFFYKMMRFKEEAYQQIIEDLEEKNIKLEKSNKLLQNVVQESLGMKISTEEKTK